MGDFGPPSDAAAVGRVATAGVVTNVGDDTGLYVPENVSKGIYWTSSSVLASTGVGGSGEAGDSTMTSGVHSGVVVETSTSDGAGGGDAVSHSRSMSLYF